jgi:hypothetical protein
MSATEIRDAQADAHAMIDALMKVDPQAVLVIRFIAGRMLAGYEQYGRLDIMADKRDFERERALELGDLLTYSAMAELRRVLAGGKL